MPPEEIEVPPEEIERCLALLNSGLLGLRRVLGLLRRRAASRIQQWWRRLYAN